jgi:hypothetical protein
MALPHASEARRFYQAAMQRMDDARHLTEGNRTTGAVYLAGYAVECMFKALVLSMAPRQRHRTIVQEFRGRRGHDLLWLRKRYLDSGGPPLPKNVVLAFTQVVGWTTELRYQAARLDSHVARTFMRHAQTLMDWMDRRI